MREENLHKRLDLNNLAKKSKTVESFLKRALRLLAREFSANVASVYLWNEEERKLILTATYGLNAKFEGEVKLGLGEGVVGQAMEVMSPMILSQGSKHPLFKGVDHLGEGSYDAYMVVPVEWSGDRMGVMVLQRDVKKPFAADHLQSFKEVAVMTIGHLRSAGLFLSLHDVKGVGGEEEESTLGHSMGAGQVFVGKRVSRTDARIALGKSVVRREHITLSNFEEVSAGREYSHRDFERAVKRTKRQLIRLQESLGEHLSEWAQNIFVGHLLILKDAAYVGRMRQRMEDGVSPPLAISMVTQAYIRFFAKSAVASIREKVLDVKDLGVRLLTNLIAGVGSKSIEEKVKGKIFITRDLFLSELMFLKYEGAAGVIEVKAINVLASHMALIASSLKIPFMIIPDERILSVQSGEQILMELTKDLVHIRPAGKLLREVRRGEKERAALRRVTGLTGRRAKNSPVRMQDGQRVQVLVNVNLLEETEDLNERGSDGIGLYRSEFPFMIRNAFPTEDEQYHLYRRVISSVKGREVNIRTLDVGGDKILPYVSEHADETNSILGLRAIRFSLKYRELFIDQLKAILRAGAGGSVKIILPLISSVEEVKQAKVILAEAKDRLIRQGEACAYDYKLGIMIEVPSVVWIMDELAQEVDFFSIGTNDLVQYLLAVDRNNEMVADFYSYYHPSVLRMIKAVVTAAYRNDIECTLCGQMAEDTMVIPFLLGVGLRRFSVSLGKLDETCAAIRGMRGADSEIIADRLLNCTGIAEARGLLRENRTF